MLNGHSGNETQICCQELLSAGNLPSIDGQILGSTCFALSRSSLQRHPGVVFISSLQLFQVDGEEIRQRSIDDFRQ